MRLLPVLDALDLATAHVRSQGEASDAAKALEQIDSLLRDILAREGVERIDAVGRPVRPDDPRRRRPPAKPARWPATPRRTTRTPSPVSRTPKPKPVRPAVRRPASRAKAARQAAAQTPARSAGPTVAQVMRAGYRLKSKVLRPAMVLVGG